MQRWDANYPDKLASLTKIHFFSKKRQKSEIYFDFMQVLSIYLHRAIIYIIILYRQRYKYLVQYFCSSLTPRYEFLEVLGFQCKQYWSIKVHIQFFKSSTYKVVFPNAHFMFYFFFNFSYPYFWCAYCATYL